MLASAPLEGLRRLISAMTLSCVGPTGRPGRPTRREPGRRRGTLLQFGERDEALAGLQIPP